MLATVWRLRVAPGDVVAAGDELVVLESMKMEIPMLAPQDGRVNAVYVIEGQAVDEDDPLVELG
jgi:biotin carboxyl carrier protein